MQLSMPRLRHSGETHTCGNLQLGCRALRPRHSVVPILVPRYQKYAIAPMRLIVVHFIITTLYAREIMREVFALLLA